MKNSHCCRKYNALVVAFLMCILIACANNDITLNVFGEGEETIGASVISK
jgi:hypothetical protein